MAPRSLPFLEESTQLPPLLASSQPALFFFDRPWGPMLFRVLLLVRGDIVLE